MATLQTLTNNIIALARRNGEVDAMVKNKLLEIKSNMTDVAASAASIRAGIAALDTPIANVNSTAQEATSRAQTVISTANSGTATTGEQLFNPITITGSTTGVAGGTITNSFACSSTLVNTTISKFETKLNNADTHIVIANNNQGSTSYSIPANTPDGTVFTLTVVAYDTLGNTRSATQSITIYQDSVNVPTILSPVANATVVYNTNGLTINTSAFSSALGMDTHASTSYKVTSDSAGTVIVASNMNDTTNLVSYTFSSSALSNIADVSTCYIWVQHTGALSGASGWSTAVAVTLVAGVEYNGFTLYRSPNGIATTIEYHWPNADGTLGELRKMEVIDAQYRNTGIAYASNNYDYDNTVLTNFNTYGNDGSWYIYNKNSYDKTTALTSVFTNALCCSQWRNLYSDKTAAENTAAWMNDSHFNKGGAAPYWTTHLTYDDGGWVIPNEFQVIVIFCCSDKLDEMDPTFSSYPDKGLGYTSTNGRFFMSSGIVWSSTESSSLHVRSVRYDGYCATNLKYNSCWVVPIRELTV